MEKKNSLSEILRNEKYIGTFVFNKVPKMVDGKRNSHRTKKPEEIIKIPNGVPAIIDKETFDKAAKRMLDNKRNATNKLRNPIFYPEKFFCGTCGSAMVGHTSYAGRNNLNTLLIIVVQDIGQNSCL